MASMKRAPAAWLVCLAAVWGPVCATAAPGSLDTTFGSGGIVTTSIGESSGGNGVAIDGSGRIVVAGTSQNGTNYDFAVVRYLPSGSLDATFGSGGKVTTPIGTSSDGGHAVAIDGSGRIVVAGSSWNGTAYDIAVVRYTSIGSLDATFGSGGKVTTSIGAGNDVGNAVAIDGSGRIVVAGTSVSDGSIYGRGDLFAVVRYTASGSLDTTFGSGGTVTTPIGDFAEGRAMAIDGNGRIVVAGDAGSCFGRGGCWFVVEVVRYLESGSLDATFGSGGMAITEPLPEEEYGAITGQGMAIDGSGRIVIAGNALMVRFLASGSLDTTFGSGGTVWWWSPSFLIWGNAVAIDGSGRIVVAAMSYRWGPSDADFAVLRYLPSGTLDATFGSGGTVRTPIGAGDDVGNAVAIDGSGRIVVAGSTQPNATGPSDLAVVRYLGGSAGCQ